jgi:hypothetical protein
MIESEHPKSQNPRVWADALLAFAVAWGEREALDRESLASWFRDAMSQAYTEGRKDGESAIRGVKKPWFAEHRPNPERKHWWQVWIPAYVTVKMELKK